MSVDLYTSSIEHNHAMRIKLMGGVSNTYVNVEAEYYRTISIAVIKKEM